MLKDQQLEPVFVRSLPETLIQGCLYVSMEFATIAHLCCCGCGEEVITPLSPTDWRLEFNGIDISLSPSVGSWSLDCRSHYIIRKSRVIQAGSWSADQIKRGRLQDKVAKSQFYNEPKIAPAADSVPSQEATQASESLGSVAKLGFWPRLLKRLGF